MSFKLFKKLKDFLKNPLQKNAIFLMADNVLASALGFVFWTVAARFYVETEVGLASTIISSIGLIGMASTLGFSVGLIRFLPAAKEEDYSKIINSCFTISGIIALSMGFIFVLGLSIWSPPLLFLQESIFLIITFVLFAFAWTTTHLLNGVFISARKADYVFLKNSVMTSVLKVILLIVLSLTALDLMNFNIYFSWGFASIIAIFFSVFFLIPRIKKSYRPRIQVKSKAINHMMRFSAGNYIAIFFNQISFLILPLMITNVLSAEITAYFYIAWMIAALLFVIPSAVGTSLLSEMSHEEGRYGDKVGKAAKFITLLLLPAIIIFLLLGDKLLLLFGTSYSTNASAALRLFVISSIPLAINAIYVAVKNARKQVRYVIFVNVAIAVGTLSLSLLLMTGYGLYGIATAWLTSQSVVAGSVLISYLLRRNRGNKNHVSKNGI